MLTGRTQTPEQRQKQGIGTIGKIKIGYKTEKGFPTSTDYFIPDANEEYKKLFWSTFGDKPKSLKIVFLSNDFTHACNEQHELRDKAGKIYCKTDGNIFGIANGDTWTWTDKEKLMSEFGSMKAFNENAMRLSGSKKGWETRLTLRFMIPELKGLLGEWQLSTKGKKSSIDQIVQTFDKVQESAGSILMIPFDLTVEKVKSDRSGSKNAYPVIKLIPNVTYNNLQLLSNNIMEGMKVWNQGVLTNEKILELSQAK